MEFNNQSIHGVMGAAEEALKAVGEKYGVSFRFAGVSMTSDHASMKLECSVLRKAGSLSREAEDFLHYCKMYGMEKEWLNKVFLSRNKEHRLIGLMPNRPKYPILVEEVRSGKKLLMTADGVKRLLSGQVLSVS